MMEARWGKLWLSKEVADKAKEKFDLSLIGDVTFKGKGKTIQVFELLDKKSGSTDKFYRGDMVGRENETSILNEQLKPILDGRFGGVVYVYGEAGIGKSRFIYEVTQGYEEKAKICMLQCDSILKKSMNPFVYFLNEFFGQNDARSDKEKENNFADALDDLLEQLEDIDDERKDDIIDEIERTESFFKASLGLDTSGTLYEELEPKLKFENTIYAIKNLFKGLSLIQPVIIQIEDIHWIDEDSKKVIQMLSRNVADYPFIVIATSRYNDDASKPVLTLDDDITPVEIELKELGNESVEAIIKSWLGYKASDGLLSFIIDRTQSNPFYVEQFCLYLMENTFIELDDNLYHLKAKTEGIPRGINSILVARIDRLSAELKELVQIASVLGREFDITLLIEMLKTLNELIDMYKTISKDDFDTMAISTILKSEKVEELLADGNRESLWNEFTELKYIFKHALLVQTAYDMQLRNRLRNLHRVAAETIERLHKDDPTHYADLAYHYEKAEIIDKAKVYLEKAGDYFKKEYRNEEAIEMYDRLMELEEDKEKVVDVILKKAKLLRLTKGNAENISLLNSGRELAQSINNTELEIRINIELSGNYINSDLDKTINILNKSKKLSEEIKNYELLGSIHTELAHLYNRNEREVNKALNHLYKALDFYKKIDSKKNISCNYSQK